MGIFDNDKSYYHKASVKFNQRNFENAIKYYDKALKINPNYAAAWNDKGAALTNLGISNEALKCYDNALKIKPDFSLSLINKARLLLNKFNDYEEAINCYNVLLKMDKKVFKKGIKGSGFKYPDIYADIWNERGLAFFNLENYNEAINCYKKALGINPSHIMTLRNKEVAENELNLKNVECPNCGTENLDTADFCQECGTRFNSIDENLFCPNCNTQIGSETKFCPTCGNKIEEVPKEKICPKCNFMINDEANFCPECGENLEIKDKVLIDINNDSEEKIASIIGIGPVLAKKAVKMRESKGGFNSTEDFCISIGLKPHIASRVEDYITCNPVKRSEKPKFPGRVVDW